MNWKLVVAAAWTLLIVALCSIPGESLPAPDIVGLDKVAHFTLFGVFAWLWLGASDRRFRRSMRNVLLTGLLLAGLTEIYQGLLPFDRSPSLMDAVANTVGLLAGMLSYRTVVGRSPADPAAE